MRKLKLHLQNWLLSELGIRIICLFVMVNLVIGAYYLDKYTPVKQVVSINGNHYQLVTVTHTDHK